MKIIDELVPQYYDAVIDPKGWSGAVAGTGATFGAWLSTLSVLDSVNRKTHFAVCDGPTEYTNELIEKVAAKLPYYGVLHKLELETPTVMEDIYKLYGPGGREAQYEGEYGEWVKRTNFQDCLAVVVTRRGSLHGLLHLTMNMERPPIQREDHIEIARLAPHVRRAVTISDLFGFRQAVGDFLSTLLDQLNVSVLVVDSTLRIVHANAKAQRDLETADHIESKGGKLTFKSTYAEAAIADAVTTGQRSEVALAGRGIDVPLAQVSHPAVAHVLPLASRDKRPSAKSVAAIFIAEPNTVAMPTIEAVANLFGLTRAERNVMQQVAGGLGRAEIAAANCVKDGTVKAQLNSIFEKTGVSSQRALEQLVRDLAPPLLRK